MTFEEAVQEDVKRSLSDWAMYFYRIGYEDAESKIVYCKDCVNMKPFESRGEGFSYCAKIGCIVEVNNYCCWAKRKEE